MKIICFILLITAGLFARCQKESPKIVIGIVVDQMCYDYLYRFEKIIQKMALKN